VLKGLLAGGVTLGVAAVFPEALVLPFLVAALAFSAGVYPGLAMSAPENGHVAFQWVFGLLILIMGMLGLFLTPVALTGAFLLHALWSLAQKFTALGDGIPEGYPSGSFAFDLVMAGFLVYMWAAGL
jgi:hypothetical protein